MQEDRISHLFLETTFWERMMNTMTDNKNQTDATGVAIRARRLTDESERMNCLPDLVGHACVVLEHSIYQILGMLSPDYDGGLWDYFKLSNGGFFMAPVVEGQYRILCEGNGFCGAVDAEVAGIIATAMAYSYLSFRPNGEHFARLYQKLSAFIEGHSQARLIYAALD